MSFLRQYEDDCRCCLQTHRCHECRARDAKGLLAEMRRSLPPPQQMVDNSLSARCKRVLAQLQQAGLPIPAKEIVLPDCPAYLKEFTLNHMMNHGMIRRKRERFFYVYFLPNNKGCNK